MSNTARNILVSSVLATGALHAGIEVLSNEAHGPRVEIGLENSHMGHLYGDKGLVDLPAHDEEGDPYLAKEVTQTQVPGEHTQEQDTTFNFTNGAYARKFDADPHASELDQDSMKSLMSAVKKFQQDGWHVEVHVKGLASAEDDSEADDDGVLTSSPRNQDLADFRAKTLIDDLVEQGLDQSLIVQEPGEENNLSTVQADLLEDTRAHFGYSSIKAMIDAYNFTPGSTPPAVNQLLDVLLGEHRGVTAIVKATRENVSPDTQSQDTKEVCYIPVTTVKTTMEKYKSYKATVPYGAIIIFVFC